MQRLLRLEYLLELNQIRYESKWAQMFYQKYLVPASKKTVEVIIESAVPTSDDFEDVHLQIFFSTGYELQRYIEDASSFSAIIFPKYEKVNYTLKQDGEFFTNLHNNSDPLLVKDVKGIYLHPTDHDSHIWIKGNKLIFNRVSFACLFMENPFEKREKYPGFEEFINVNH